MHHRTVTAAILLIGVGAPATDARTPHHPVKSNLLHRAPVPAETLTGPGAPYLKQMLHTLRRAHALQFQAVIVTHGNGPGVPPGQTVLNGIVAQQGRFRIDLSGAAGAATIASAGKTITVYSPITNSYRHIAPEELGPLVGRLQRPLQDLPPGSPLVWTFDGKRAIAGRQTDLVHGKGPLLNESIWIDSRRHLPVRLLVSGPVNIDVSLRQVRLNPPTPPGFFNFAPPKGAHPEK